MTRVTRLSPAPGLPWKPEQRCSTARWAGSGAARSRHARTGNVATEDLVYLLEREGVDTGVDLDALIAVAEWLARVLGRDLPGRVYRAGAWPGVGSPKGV